MPVKSHKRWIATLDETHGILITDAGATKAIRENGKSLLLAGIIACEGNFEAGDLVSIKPEKGPVFAHGLSTTDSETLANQLKTASVTNNKNSEIPNILVHRDKLVLLDW